MTYADTAQRAALIGGLRAPADYLESSPEIPAPTYSHAFTVPPDGTCAETRAEIDVIAARLGTSARDNGSGHYVAARSFGPVEYHAIAICKQDHHGKPGADR